MNIILPTWEEINNRQKSDRTISQSVNKLNPIEQFIYENEPVEKSNEWRASLKLAIESAWMVEKL